VGGTTVLLAMHFLHLSKLAYVPMRSCSLQFCLMLHFHWPGLMLKCTITGCQICIFIFHYSVLDARNGYIRNVVV